MASMDEAILKRVLPHSMEAEQSVIGSMIMDREAIVVASEMICGEDFYNKSYGVLFDSMVELNDQGQPVDLVTLQNRLKGKGCAAGNQQPGIHQGSDYGGSHLGQYQVLCQYRGGKVSAAQIDPAYGRDSQ